MEPVLSRKSVKVLVSNDDGFRAEGLETLVRALDPVAFVTIVAPDRNRSGASNSLTLDAPLRVRNETRNVYSVEGTPTDCVHLAITGLLDEEPDMVFSGINDGANLGDDVLYSGTVAAAMEGRFLGLPAIAMSLVSTGAGHFDTAGEVACRIIERLIEVPLPRNTILNVNVPDVPFDAVKGFRATRLGHRHRAERAIRERDPRGREIWWIGPAGAGEDAGPGTDFDAIANGYVSVTPLDVDLTRHVDVDGLKEWLAVG